VTRVLAVIGAVAVAAGAAFAALVALSWRDLSAGSSSLSVELGIERDYETTGV